MSFFVLIVTFLSSLVQSVVGFGFNITFMAIGPIMLDYNISQILCFSGTCIGNVANFTSRLKKIRFKEIIIPTVAYCIASYISVSLTKGIDMAVMRRLLGGVLFLLSIYFVFFSGKIKIRATNINSVIAGIISGVGGSLFAISGPPMAIYYVSALEDKEEYMATIQCYFFITSIATIIIKIMAGSFAAISPIWAVMVIVGAVLGFVVGRMVYKRLNGDVAKLCVYAFMAVSGIWILING